MERELHVSNPYEFLAESNLFDAFGSSLSKRLTVCLPCLCGELFVVCWYMTAPCLRPAHRPSLLDSQSVPRKQS